VKPPWADSAESDTWLLRCSCGSVRTSCTGCTGSRRPRGAARAADSAAWSSLPLPLPLLPAKDAGRLARRDQGWGPPSPRKVTRPRRFDTGTPRGGSHRADAGGLRSAPDRRQAYEPPPRVKSPLRPRGPDRLPTRHRPLTINTAGQSRALRGIARMLGRTASRTTVVHSQAVHYLRHRQGQVRRALR
jgi:hypothetical protein